MSYIINFILLSWISFVSIGDLIMAKPQSIDPGTVAYDTNQPRSGVLAPLVVHPILQVQTPEEPNNQKERSAGCTVESEKEKPEKPRCITSLFSWYVNKKVNNALDNLPLTDPLGALGSSGGGIQGGIITPGSQFGGLNPPPTPDLSQATDAWNQAQGMQDQLNAAQFAGVRGPGIPFSPPGFRGEYATAQLYLPNGDLVIAQR